MKLFIKYRTAKSNYESLVFLAQWIIAIFNKPQQPLNIICLSV